jgi:cellulose synthase/poly-beta-1,6-N-acetylglucosamine synthase-like glycosyltransferase
MINRPLFRRFLEILPGTFAWGALVLPIILSQFIPSAVVTFVILFDLYWLYKAIIMTIHLVLGYRRHKQAMADHWLAKAKVLPNFKSLYHAIIIATYKEELPILRATFQAVADSDYPLKNIILVLATEERDAERAKTNAQALEKEFGHLFGHFLVTKHPGDIEGEVKGKGGNITWAARQVQPKLDDWKIPYTDVVVTTLDADNRVDRQYLAELAYNYLTHPDPVHVSFQPIPMFFNNIWEAPLPSRLLAHGTMFWVMIESTRPWRLRNFSSHSQSMKALVDIDFWSTKTIVEDGHQYWRSYFAYNGNYSVVPLHTPIYQDAVVAGTFLESVKELYLQRRRWTWGVSDIPYIIENCLKNTSAPFLDKWIRAFRAMEGHFTWATQSLYIMIAGWIPIMLNDTFNDTVLAYNFPVVASRLLTLAMIGMITNLSVGTLLLPQIPDKRRRFKLLATEWILMPMISPITSVVFGAIPALDSQTRLMFGKYLEFRVTVKTRNLEGQTLPKTIGL